MSRVMNPLSLLAIIAVAPIGCSEQLMERREPPLLHQPANVDAMQRYYEPMVKNAAAHNMTVADGYFFPHTGMLNSLGAKQLDRVCVVLDQFGGTVRYETRSTDDELVAARLAAVEQYIIDTGVETTNIEVTAALSGGRGIWSRDALAAAIKSREATEKAAQPEEAGVK